MREIAKLIVHCSATPDAMDVGFEEIDGWHRERGHKEGWIPRRGVWCGYHFIIRRNGVVELGRTIDDRGVHVAGANADSIGICLVGTHEFSDDQIRALRRLVSGLQAQFPESFVFEHREFESARRQGKTCPNLNVRGVLGFA